MKSACGSRRIRGARACGGRGDRRRAGHARFGAAAVQAASQRSPRRPRRRRRRADVRGRCRRTDARVGRQRDRRRRRVDLRGRGRRDLALRPRRRSADHHLLRARQARRRDQRSGIRRRRRHRRRCSRARRRFRATGRSAPRFRPSSTPRRSRSRSTGRSRSRRCWRRRSRSPTASRCTSSCATTCSPSARRPSRTSGRCAPTIRTARSRRSARCSGSRTSRRRCARWSAAEARRERGGATREQAIEAGRDAFYKGSDRAAHDRGGPRGRRRDDRRRSRDLPRQDRGAGVGRRIAATRSTRPASGTRDRRCCRRCGSSKASTSRRWGAAPPTRCTRSSKRSSWRTRIAIATTAIRISSRVPGAGAAVARPTRPCGARLIDPEAREHRAAPGRSRARRGAYRTESSGRAAGSLDGCGRTGDHAEPGDTTSIQVVDARRATCSPRRRAPAGCSAARSSPGDTGVPMSNRMQAFRLDPVEPERARRRQAAADDADADRRAEGRQAVPRDRHARRRQPGSADPARPAQHHRLRPRRAGRDRGAARQLAASAELVRRPSRAAGRARSRSDACARRSSTSCGRAGTCCGCAAPYGISTGIVAAGIDPVTGRLRGGADPRRERALVAY